MSARFVWTTVMTVAVAGASHLAYADGPYDSAAPRTLRAAEPTLDDPAQLPCLDADDVVGYRSCPSYGQWGDNLLAPYTFVEIELNLRHFRPITQPITYRSLTSTSTSPKMKDNPATTYDERVGVGIVPGLYTAIDIELGNFQANSLPPADPELVLGALLSVGVQHGFGPITISGEIAGGVLATSSATTIALRPEGVVEARARVDVWLSPWCTIGGVLGTDLFRQDEWMGGVDVGIHSRSYGLR